MACQLVLITPGEMDWRLDQCTRELGRRGISQARAALARVEHAPAATDRPRQPAR